MHSKSQTLAPKPFVDLKRPRRTPNAPPHLWKTARPPHPPSEKAVHTNRKLFTQPEKMFTQTEKLFTKKETLSPLKQLTICAARDAS